MQKARRHHNKLQLRPLVSVWFQVLFTPFFRVLFTFPSQYWFAIGLSVVFSLSRWCCYIQTRFHRPRHTRIILYLLSHTGLSPSMVLLSSRFCQTIQKFRADPRSLATTCGITIVFFSSRYLDVSVPWVISTEVVYGLQPQGFPHSDICGSKVICTSPQLFAAYHVLRRLREPRHSPYALICFLIFS